jgi:DNA-binding response OmpR family regulator
MSRPRVLLVDDDAVLGTAVRAALPDYDVEWAADPEAALRSALDDPPAAVLLDVSMPGMDGWEVCDILRRQSHTRDLPVIFLTGRAEVRDRISAMQAGGTAYLTKPFRAEELRARLLALAPVGETR